MKLQLIKIDGNYILVSDEEIRKGDKFYDFTLKVVNEAWINFGKHNTCKKITHSTEPLSEECKRCTGACEKCVDNIKPLSLSEVEEAINGYSVEKMALEEYDESLPNQQMAFHCRMGYKEGFKAHQELTKDKLFTVEDMINALKLYKIHFDVNEQSNHKWFQEPEEFIQLLLPKEEWDITFVDGKLKLI